MPEYLTSATKLTLLMLVIANIVMNILWIEVNETMNNITIAVISFYFGQKVANK